MDSRARLGRIEPQKDSVLSKQFSSQIKRYRHELFLVNDPGVGIEEFKRSQSREGCGSLLCIFSYAKSAYDACGRCESTAIALLNYASKLGIDSGNAMNASYQELIRCPEMGEDFNKAPKHRFHRVGRHNLAHVLHSTIQRDEIEQRSQDADLRSEEVMNRLTGHSALCRKRCHGELPITVGLQLRSRSTQNSRAALVHLLQSPAKLIGAFGVFCFVRDHRPILRCKFALTYCKIKYKLLVCPGGQFMRAGINSAHSAQSFHQDHPGRVSGGFPRWVQFGFWLCLVIAVAAVFRRAVALMLPPSGNAPPQMAELDAYFASHAVLTWVHILCALAFVSLLPFLFWRRTENSRRLESAFLLLGWIVGLTAYAMSVHAVGGWLERSAVLFFNTLFLVSLARVYVAARRGDTAGRRRWTIRAVAILLGIATTRPIMGVFFATSSATHLTARQFFGIAFWIGFSLNTIAIELWLCRSKFAREAHSA